MSFVKILQMPVKLYCDCCSEFVKEHRKLSKEIRELDYKIREEEQAEIKTGLTRGRYNKHLHSTKKYWH